MADLIPGSGTISKIYAGSSEVQKIYAGLDLVYPTGTPSTEDWDTYENGIIAIPSIGGTASGDLIVNANDPSTTLLPTVGGYNESNWPAIRYGGTDQNNYNEAWEWIAVWSKTDQQWLGYSQRSGTGYSYDRVDFRDNASSSGYMSNTIGKHCIYVGLKNQPTNFANWSDYDGDITAWESIDTSLLTYSSSNSWWNIDQSVTTWSRSGDAFGDLDYIVHNGTNMVLRVNNGTRFASLQDYIDEYEVPTFWVWINGVQYIFDTLDQVTASGDLRLLGPAISLADFEDSGSGSNSLGWTSGMTVLAEFRPSWDTYYPRVGLVAGDASSTAGRAVASYATGSVFENVSAGADNYGILKPNEFIRAGVDQIEISALGDGSYDATSFIAEGPYAAWWRGSSIGWDKGQYLTTGIFKTGIRYQSTYGDIDFNSFSSSLPVGFVIYGRDPGNVVKWAAYDGPEYDYDTYELHNYFDPAFNTNRTDVYRIPITNTGSGYTPASYASGLVGYSAPLNYCPNTGYFSDRAAVYGSMPDSAFVHHWNTNAGSGAYTSAGGWYTFGLTTTSPTGAGSIPHDVLQYSNDPDGGFRGATGDTHLMTSSKGGEKAKYWARPYPKDGLIMFMPFVSMGSAYNYRTDAGGAYIIAGEQYNFPYPENYYIPYYAFVFNGNRILIQFTGTSANQTANKTDFLARVGGTGATCTVRLRDAATTQTTVSSSTEYTYTGTWGTWTTTSVSLTLSNPSSGAPFNWTNYNDGTSEFLLPFPCAFRIEE